MSLIFLQGVSVDDVVNSGPGLVFITYPEVVLKLPGGPIWAFIFFIMLVVGNLFISLNLNNIEIFFEETLLIQKRQIRIKTAYRRVASSDTSRLEAYAGFFRLLMKGIFDCYVL